MPVRRLLLVVIAMLLGGCSLLPHGCPTALLEGDLVADGQGGLVVHEGHRFYATVRWPDGFRVEVRDKLTLVNEFGGVVATEGDQIYVGGGYTQDDEAFVACGYVSQDPP